MTGAKWSAAQPYEAFMGRWSRRLAAAAVEWMRPQPGGRWLDVGCGTGAVSEAVLRAANPESLLGIDASEGYLAAAAERLADPVVRFEIGDAAALPVPDESVDQVVCGLVLNHIPDAGTALREMRRVLVDGGRATAWVWGYSGGMQMLRRFWDAAVALDPTAASLDQGTANPIGHDGGLQKAFRAAGFSVVDAGTVEVETVFSSFDDYWLPFMGGQGPSARYLLSLSDRDRERLRVRLASTLPTQPDGSIPLTASASIVTAPSG